MKKSEMKVGEQYVSQFGVVRKILRIGMTSEFYKKPVINEQPCVEFVVVRSGPGRFGMQKKGSVHVVSLMAFCDWAARMIPPTSTI